MHTHLHRPKPANRWNGSGRKTIKTQSAVLIWQRRATGKGLFEPQLVKKHQTHMSDEIECKIISLFGLGVSYLDIAGQIAEICGPEVSNASIRAITDKLIPKNQVMAKPPAGLPLPVRLARCDPLLDQAGRALREQSGLHGLDLSRFDAAPLIAFTATKKTNYGTATNRRI